MTSDFSDYKTALKARDAIKALVEDKVNEMRPRYRYGIVTSLNPDQQKATVRLNGEVDSVPVAMGAVIPKEVGQTVRVNGMPGDRYIEDVYGEVEIPEADIDVDVGEIDGVPVGGSSSPPTGLILTTGSLEEDVWIDASWTPPAGTSDISGYDVELARQDGVTFELAQVYRVGVTSHRMAGLRPATTYGVRVATINRIGVRSIYLPSSGYQLVITTVDDTIPGQVTGVTISSGFRSLTLRWNEAPERDVAHGTGQYEVHIDTTNTFGAGKTIQYTTGTVLSISGLSVNTQYFARVRAVDNSGNFGAWSSTVNTVTAKIVTVDLTDANVTTAALANGAVDTSKLADLAVIAAKLANSSVDATKIANLAVGSAAIQALAVGTAHIADAAIVTAKIGNLAVTTANIADAAIVNAKIANAAIDNAKISDLDAGKINAGTISADRIAANSLSVEKLSSSNMSTVNLTIIGSGAIKVGNPPTDGLIINNQGLRLYQSSVAKVILDNTGNATFEGNINASTITGGILRTAASGSRVQIDATNYQQVSFYSGFAGEVSPGLMSVGGSAAIALLTIKAPIYSNTFGSGATIDLISGDGSFADILGDWRIYTRDPGVGIYKAQIRGYATDASPPEAYVVISFNDSCRFEYGSTLIGDMTTGSSHASSRLRLSSPAGNAKGALKVHNGEGDRVHVASYDDVLYIPIKASAFEVSSSRTTKKDIIPLNLSSLDVIKRLNPVSFKFEAENLTRLGLIAEEIALVAPDVTLNNGDGQPAGWDVSGVIALLVRAVQELTVQLSEKGPFR